MTQVLEAILQRRAIKVFDPVEIPADTREQILHAARVAPSSFNIQPYRFYWVETPEMRSTAARLCFGQSPAATASALIVAVADIGSWKATTASELAWMRSAGFPAKKIADYERRAKFEIELARLEKAPSIDDATAIIAEVEPAKSDTATTSGGHSGWASTTTPGLASR